MSGPGIGRGSSTRTVRKIEAPRPLKTTPTNDTKNKPSLSPLVLPANAIDSAEKLLLFMDAVVTGIMSDDEQSLKPENKALLTANIVSLCENLKIYGPQLENTKYQGHLDRAFMTFRQGMVCNHLEVQARYHLLNILELRECHWSTPKSPKALNMKSQNQSLDEDLPHMKLQPFSPVQVEPTVHLGPDEIIKSSGKYRDKPSKPSKNYCKEEIIIRNSDSGKVMGIKGRRVHMIEQLSETIISFQKVQPTFKERLVQITGPTEENVSYASQLIEQTIRNNSSPVRELGESDSSYSSDESGEKPGIRENSFLDDSTNWNWQNEGYQFKHKVSFNDCVLTLTGNDYYFVTMAKSVLDNYFSKLTPAEYLNYYNTCDNSVGEPVVWENDVLAEGNEVPTIDLTSDKVDIYGAGDAEEDHILKQLHYDLNNMNIEPSSLTSGTVSFSDTIDEIAEPLEDDKPADNDYTKIIYTKEFLLECRKKAISQREPENWQWVKSQYPAIVKTPDEYMPDVKATVNDTPLEEDESVDQTRSVEENEVVKNQNALDEIL